MYASKAKQKCYLDELVSDTFDGLHFANIREYR